MRIAFLLCQGKVSFPRTRDRVIPANTRTSDRSPENKAFTTIGLYTTTSTQTGKSARKQITKQLRVFFLLLLLLFYIKRFLISNLFSLNPTLILACYNFPQP